MMVFVVSFGAILLGMILVVLLAEKKEQSEEPEKEFYSNNNSRVVQSLIDMPRNEFEELVTVLLINLGFQIEEKTMVDFGGMELAVIDPAPITGGKFIVQCHPPDKTELVDSTQVIQLLDRVKGESAMKGILITPHFFTVAALNAAADTQVELINGKRFAVLLKETGLCDSFCP
jgi:hypothetical protein